MRCISACEYVVDEAKMIRYAPSLFKPAVSQVRLRNMVSSVRPFFGYDDHDITGLSHVGDMPGCCRLGRFGHEKFCRSWALKSLFPQNCICGAVSFHPPGVSKFVHRTQLPSGLA